MLARGFFRGNAACILRRCGTIFAQTKFIMLTDSQKQQVAAWVGEGLSLAQIQTKIESEFGVSMTYMDVRFLVDDLNLELCDTPTETTQDSPTGTPAEKGEAQADATSENADVQGTTATGGVSLSVDPVQMQGEIASGDVVFSDGVRGKWFIDRAGRAGLDGFPKGYQPPASDVPEFQKKLVAELRKLGLA